MTNEDVHSFSSSLTKSSHILLGTNKTLTPPETQEKKGENELKSMLERHPEYPHIIPIKPDGSLCWGRCPLLECRNPFKFNQTAYTLLRPVYGKYLCDYCYLCKKYERQERVVQKTVYTTLSLPKYKPPTKSGDFEVIVLDD
jgi:hypothetical protein